MISCVWTHASTCWNHHLNSIYLREHSLIGSQDGTPTSSLTRPHSCISFALYLRVSNPAATEVSIQWLDLSLNNDRSSHRPSPFQYSVTTGELGSGFPKTRYDPNFICDFCFILMYMCLCKYFVSIHICIYIFMCTYKVSERSTLKC